jgi:hypothetical protein
MRLTTEHRHFAAIVLASVRVARVAGGRAQHQMIHRYQGAIVDLIAGMSAEPLNLGKG